MSTQADSIAAWVRLEQTPGIGPASARKLLAVFGLPDNIFAANYSALQKVVPENIVQTLTSLPTDATLALIERTQNWLTEPGNYLLTLADDAYPPSLLEITDPPLVLYVKGRPELLLAPSVAVVGSRNATTQGQANAENFSKALSRAGLTIVSGLALGIDAAAHRGGLQGPGSSIAVIGTGADIVYPARNRSLAHQIAEHGCLVSEYPLGMPAIAANFPRRNRLISGLARGVLVVEAAAQSGSLITARLGAEQGKDVFAIPGSIHSPLSKGCHLLLKQGAKLVESAQDVLEELRLLPPTLNATASAIMPASGSTDPQLERLLNHMGFDPVEANALGERSGLDAASLSTHLLSLELGGMLERLPDGRYRRLAI